MKIAVVTDVHGNLPALQAALSAISQEDCDAIYHTGDCIGIGPYPAECLDLILNTPRLFPVMGNHDAWFAHGLPDPRQWRDLQCLYVERSDMNWKSTAFHMMTALFFVHSRNAKFPRGSL